MVGLLGWLGRFSLMERHVFYTKFIVRTGAVVAVWWKERFCGIAGFVVGVACIGVFRVFHHDSVAQIGRHLASVPVGYR